MKRILAELRLFWLFGIKHNTGLSFHILGGIGFSVFVSVAWVLFFAITWEVVEVIASLYKYGSWQEALIKTKYKTTKNWLYDSLGDIIGAVIGAL